MIAFITCILPLKETLQPVTIRVGGDTRSARTFEFVGRERGLELGQKAMTMKN